ncbi:NAD-dependent epimerase/dehydratase family protein [Actinophytocola algeriensis]|uniref:Nucleoside-diphosphate-sugar epimerase n=1 Tax=Actinophytocola algeriensis TaxID=1768010 RepID=A0A7W7Q055_9PSEU|nr:NAD-dependent epimerase/dehydratase family protein [Actinophytocola algeriensis]MBB4904536.1 nucleoside-diphosphate-sugar epimerase [Actinophytocola algeriensis]MBE1476605.1 nucleoside-diphosphate-sugar epimerase [Actinophytocola algeriensis]
MTRVVVLGGTGHIGGYLVPRLVAAGHEVTVLTRGKATPYRQDGAWSAVTTVVADRDAEEAAGTFGARVRDLGPDVVIDLICFTLASARHLVEALTGRVQHFLHCGTIWIHGPSVEVPTTEEAPRRPFGEYGVRKAEIEAYLLDQARRHGFPATLLHPGHISGPGWVPVNPAGNLDLDVYRRLAEGEEVALPNLGLETLHHVHADDVAQSFTAAMARRSVAVGESFHVVSPAALTLRGFAERVAGWYGREADLAFLPWEWWRETVTPAAADLTWDHIAHSPNSSIAKARRLLGYRPRYSSLEAVREALEWLAAHDRVPKMM